MEIFVFDKVTNDLSENISLDQLPEILRNKDKIVWADFEVSDKESLREAEDILLNIFKFHHLTIEDCREPRNQPKIESFPNYLFFIVHGIRNETKTTNFVTKELDGYLGEILLLLTEMKCFAVLTT